MFERESKFNGFFQRSILTHLINRKIHSLIGHTAEVSSAQFNWDCSRIVTGSMDKTCKLWDTLSGQLIDADRLLDRSNQIFV